MADSVESAIETELETLEAIYIHELKCTRKEDGTVDKISVLLHPATGHDTRKQYVCMTLVFSPSLKYPDEPPDIQICNPRGLGEEEMASLFEALMAKAEEIKGEVMLYTLIEMAKDGLTDGNIPRCPCCVCLEHFDVKDCFHRTACYHYFHTGCLHKYIQHTQAQLEEEKKEVSESRHLDSNSKKKRTIACPMCRSPLVEEDLQVVMAGEVEDGEEKLDVFVMPPELREQQRKMAEVYQRQKAKGGIIDPEMEKNKFLVNQEERLPVPNTDPSAPAELIVKHHHSADAKGRKEEKTESRRDDRGKGRGWNRGRHHDEFHRGSFGNRQRKVHTVQTHSKEDLVNRVGEDSLDHALPDGVHHSSERSSSVSTGEQERFCDNIEGVSVTGLKTNWEPGRSRDGFYQGSRGGHQRKHEVDGRGRREEWRNRDGRRDYGRGGVVKRDERAWREDQREWLASGGSRAQGLSCNITHGADETAQEKTNVNEHLEKESNPHCDNGQSWRDHRPEHRNSHLHQQDNGPRKSNLGGRVSSGRQHFRDKLGNIRVKDGTREREQKDFATDERDGPLESDGKSVKDTNEIGIVQPEIHNVSVNMDSKTSAPNKPVKGEDNFSSDKQNHGRGKPTFRGTYEQRQDADYKCENNLRSGSHRDGRDNDRGFDDNEDKPTGAGARDRKHHGASGRASYPRRAHNRQDGHRPQQYTNHQRHEQWRHQDRHGFIRNRPDRGDVSRNLQSDDTGRNVDRGQGASNGENSIPADPQDDGKDDLQIREINNRWRQLNYGHSFDDGNHSHNGIVSFGTHDDDENDQRLDCNETTDQQSDDVDLYYIGYRDMITQEESWEDEIDPFATERRRIKASKREDYDQMRAEDHRLYQAHLKKRVAMERDVLEEERRRMKEESLRPGSSEETLKGKDLEKSVLELFKERQKSKHHPEMSAQKKSGDGRVVVDEGNSTLSVGAVEEHPVQSHNSAEDKQTYINTDVSQIKWFGKSKVPHQQQQQVGRSHAVRNSQEQELRSNAAEDSHQKLRNEIQNGELTLMEIRNSYTSTTNKSYHGYRAKIKGGSTFNCEIKVANSDGFLTGVKKVMNSKQKNFIKPPPLKFSKNLENVISLDNKKCIEANSSSTTTLSTTTLSTTPLLNTMLSNDHSLITDDSIIKKLPQEIQAMKDSSIKNSSELDWTLGHVMALGHGTQAPPQSTHLKKLPKLASLNFKKQSNRNSGDAGQPANGPRIDGMPFTSPHIADVTNKRERAHPSLDLVQDQGKPSSSNNLRSYADNCFNGTHQYCENGPGLDMQCLSNCLADMDSLKENVCSFRNL